MHDKENWRWIDPFTSEVYDLSHVKAFNTSFEVILSKGGDKILIDAEVQFSNHCFSRTRQPDDPDELIISREIKRGGIIEERVFCPKRWSFSKELPDIIQNLAYKNCLKGGATEIVYRQEQARAPGHHDGWYICIRLNYKPNRVNEPNTIISIRSVHWRNNRPHDIRGHGGKRFCMILSEYLKPRMK